MTVLDFQHSSGESLASWTSRGALVEKQYDGPIWAVVLASGKGVLVVEPCSRGPSNAVILHEDGSEKARVLNPFRFQGALCFTEAGYWGSELTLVSRLSGTEMACVFDEEGEALRQYEIR